MNKLNIEKKKLLNLQKEPEKMFDILNNVIEVKKSHVHQLNDNFIESVIIPEIKTFNAIGFKRKDFLCYIGDDNQYITDADLKWFDMKYIKSYLESLGLNVSISEEYINESLDSGVFIQLRYLIVEWSFDDNSSLFVKELADEFLGFDIPYYNNVEEYVRGPMLSALKEAADKNLNHLVYTLADEYSSFFSKIVISEVLRRNNIFASFSVCETISLLFHKENIIDEANLNDFYDNKVTLYWDKPYDEYSKSNKAFDAKYLTSELRERFSKINTTGNYKYNTIDVMYSTGIKFKTKRGYNIFRLALFLDSSVIINASSNKAPIDEFSQKDIYNDKEVKFNKDAVYGKENTLILEILSKISSNKELISIVSYRLIISFILFVLKSSPFTLAYYGLVTFVFIKEVLWVSKDVMDSNSIINRNFITNRLPSSTFFIVSIAINSLSLKLITLAFSLAPILSNAILKNKEDKN